METQHIENGFPVMVKYLHGTRKVIVYKEMAIFRSLSDSQSYAEKLRLESPWKNNWNWFDEGCLCEFIDVCL